MKKSIKILENAKVLMYNKSINIRIWFMAGVMLTNCDELKTFSTSQTKI